MQAPIQMSRHATRSGEKPPVPRDTSLCVPECFEDTSRTLPPPGVPIRKVGSWEELLGAPEGEWVEFVPVSARHRGEGARPRTKKR